MTDPVEPQATIARRQRHQGWDRGNDGMAQRASESKAGTVASTLRQRLTASGKNDEAGTDCRVRRPQRERVAVSLEGVVDPDVGDIAATAAADQNLGSWFSRAVHDDDSRGLVQASREDRRSQSGRTSTDDDDGERCVRTDEGIIASFSADESAVSGIRARAGCR